MAGSDSPAEVFRLLSDDIRVNILEALAVAQNESDQMGSGPTELTFSDIYKRIDVENTSKLSYHLGELVGPLLRKTEQGYSFTHAGEQFVRMILADNYEPPPEFDPIGVEEKCLLCDQPALEARLQYQFFVVYCTHCEEALAGHPVTPALVRSFEGTELVARAASKQAVDYRQIREGICIGCHGSLSTTVISMEEILGEERTMLVVRDECEQCLRCYSGPLTYAVAYHPAALAFYWERGIDLSSRGMWELYRYADHWSAERLSADPDEYRVVMRHDPDELHVYLDGDATVTRTERVRNRTVE